MKALRKDGFTGTRNIALNEYMVLSYKNWLIYICLQMCDCVILSLASVLSVVCSPILAFVPFTYVYTALARMILYTYMCWLSNKTVEAYVASLMLTRTVMISDSAVIHGLVVSPVRHMINMMCLNNVIVHTIMGGCYKSLGVCQRFSARRSQHCCMRHFYHG